MGPQSGQGIRVVNLRLLILCVDGPGYQFACQFAEVRANVLKLSNSLFLYVASHSLLLGT